MKVVSIVFNSPNLTNRIFEMTDASHTELVRTLALSWAKGVSETVYVSIEDEVNYRTGAAKFYLRSDLIAYIKVVDKKDE